MNPSLTLADPYFGSIGVRFDRWDGNCPQYEWTINTTQEVFRGTDLRLGSRTSTNANEALCALLSFLGAFAEGIAYSRRSENGDSENLDLFPEGMREWADAVGSDEFSMMADDLGMED